MKFRKFVLLAPVFLALAAGCASAPKENKSAKPKRSGLTQKEVSTVASKHSEAIRNCYKRELDQNPKFETKINVRFQIGPKGNVLRAVPVKPKAKKRMSKTEATQLNRLKRCVVSQIKTWKFPKPGGGVKMNVTYPFVFKSI